MILERDELLTELATLAGNEVAVLDHVPEELVAPAVLVTPAEDYLLPAGERFDPNEYVVRLDAHVLVDLVGNEAAAEDLDELLGRLLPAFAGKAWELEAMSAPGPFHTTQWLAHGVRLRLSAITTLT